MRTITALASVTLVASALPAQAPVSTSPAAAATTVRGTSNNWYPFGAAQMAYQQVHSANSFSTGGPLTVSSLRFRPRTQGASPTIDVELWMADSPNDAMNADGTFANNVVSGSEVQVFNRRMISLPNVTRTDWDLTFPFDTPFTWTGGHLSWRTIVHGNSTGQNTHYSIDAFAPFGDTSRTGSFTGCQSALGTQPPTHFARVRGPNGVCDFWSESFVASGGLPAVLTFGFSETDANGLNLPFDLTPLGAPGCMLVNDIHATATGTTRTEPEGGITMRLRIPNDPTLPGAVFYTQYLFLQTGSNALGIFLSPGSKNTIGTNYGVTRITAAYGSSQGWPDLQYGLAIGLN